jgi:hypothetical protein
MHDRGIEETRLALPPVPSAAHAAMWKSTDTKSASDPTQLFLVLWIAFRGDERQMAASARALMEGALERKTALGFRSKRYCKLIDNQFFMFKSPDYRGLEEVIQIGSDCRIEVVDGNKFRLAPPCKDPVIFQAETCDEMMRWLFEIRACAFTNPKMSTGMFSVIACVGRGHFGRVLLCEQKATGEQVALKVIGKAPMIQRKKVKFVMAERNILSKVRSPFIVALKFAFQTPANFILGLEYVPGGDMYHQLERVLSFTLPEAKFYIAEIACALDRLHQFGIIYRDLKPENVLFDADGHIKLTDFGLSRELGDDGTAKSFCGTLEYVAPEMAASWAYAFAVDWWSLGVMTYEMLYGRTPFAGQDDPEAQVLRHIRTNEPKFPRDAHPDVVSFVNMLLEKDPARRAAFAEVRNSKLFEGTDWNDVADRRLVPSFRPDVKDPSINFDIEAVDGT